MILSLLSGMTVRTESPVVTTPPSALRSRPACLPRPGQLAELGTVLCLSLIHI